MRPHLPVCTEDLLLQSRGVGVSIHAVDVSVDIKLLLPPSMMSAVDAHQTLYHNLEKTSTRLDMSATHTPHTVGVATMTYGAIDYNSTQMPNPVVGVRERAAGEASMARGRTNQNTTQPLYGVLYCVCMCVCLCGCVCVCVWVCV